jgi:hypothetical protein
MIKKSERKVKVNGAINSKCLRKNKLIVGISVNRGWHNLINSFNK